MFSRTFLDRAMLSISLATLALTYLAGKTFGFWIAAVILVAWLGLRTRQMVRQRYQASDTPQEPTPATTAPATAKKSPLHAAPVAEDTGDLIEGLLAESRYALLLRPQIVGNLTADQITRGLTLLDEEMAMIAAGDVAVQYWRAQGQPRDKSGDLAATFGFFLDRYPVTNAQFQRFVDSGAYEQSSLWDPEIWPSVEQFVDQSGESGPRFWQDGKHPAGLQKHPVVGVNWYEARAFANWVGKRLPTDAEWVKAAAWPVQSSGRRPIQRRYPWGESMERKCAHLWTHETTGTAEVDKTPGGATPDAVHQLIGNVWEWMHGNFGGADLAAGIIDFSSPMKSIRGGAFDTYFDAQAATQFQSGECVLGRKHNIGFRCAVSVADLALSDESADDQAEPTEEDLSTLPEEAAR
ncbi:formylglycine-generating enzyme family protein [Lignipirellula cremea]|uniref:Serine/threonine-protein kinase pkn1 n=1 Tax=Lignipirellula cremea TaxID=2528010 RepID=A0A518DNA1_9BACT|nr:formylglycine-generating enzyme family protein [Lignipirellula cremea]QDU93314.1 Serine/threonine-protein kinase pkn1 [Lignipirellula cremea]